MKPIRILTFLLIFSYSVSAQDIADFFISLPSNYLNLLDSEKRAQLIANSDLNNSAFSEKIRLLLETKNNNLKKDSTIINNYGGTSKLLNLDLVNNYIKINTSKSGYFEAKRWTKMDGSYIFGISFGACGPVCDGDIIFMDENYNIVPLGKESFPSISFIDYLEKDSIMANNKSGNDIKKKFDIIFLKFEFFADNNKIAVYNNNKSYLEENDYKNLLPYLKGNVIYLDWKDDKFTKEQVFFKP